MFRLDLVCITTKGCSIPIIDHHAVPETVLFEGEIGGSLPLEFDFDGRFQTIYVDQSRHPVINNVGLVPYRRNLSVD